jgi:hypothetical protein
VILFSFELAAWLEVLKSLRLIVYDFYGMLATHRELDSDKKKHRFTYNQLKNRDGDGRS